MASRYLATVRRAMSMPSARSRSTMESSDSTPSAVSASIRSLILCRTASAEWAAASPTPAIEAVIQRFADAGSTIVMTTHDLGQARRLADEVVFLHAGRVIEKGPAPAFFERPRSREARAFLNGDLLW